MNIEITKIANEMLSKTQEITGVLEKFMMLSTNNKLNFNELRSIKNCNSEILRKAVELNSILDGELDTIYHETNLENTELKGCVASLQSENNGLIYGVSN